MTKQDWQEMLNQVAQQTTNYDRAAEGAQISLECFDAVAEVYARRGKEHPSICTGKGRNSIERDIEYNQIWLKRWEALGQLIRDRIQQLDTEERLKLSAVAFQKIETADSARRRYWMGEAQ